MRGDNELIARHFDELPVGKKGPWVIEIIKDSNPQEFLVRGANLVPGKKGLLGGETPFGGLSQPNKFPASFLSKSYNRCTKPDGAIFYLSKTTVCPGVEETPNLPQAPLISSNPNPAIANGQVSFSSTNCAFKVNWYKNGSFIQSGTSYSVSSTGLNDSYSAKCKNGSLESGLSNRILIMSKAPEDDGNVRITEPNRPAYYYSNNQPPS